MSVRYTDSLSKLKNYLQLLTVRHITISPLFFRDYSCPSHCGGCCYNFTLVYLEGERWEKFKQLYPEHVNNFTERTTESGTKVYEDRQIENKNHHCKHLDMSNGRCNIHKSNPFSCEFELMKITNVAGKISLINKLYGRGWQMKRIDGQVGAMCKMLPFDYEKFLRDLKLLKELHQIALQLNFNDTILPEVIEYLEQNKVNYSAGLVSNTPIVIRKKTNIQ